MDERAAELIRSLGLEPHPEGGHYAEIFRSTRRVRCGRDDRSAVTVIHFLLAAGEYSRWHVVASDEIWHFHEGDPFELITFDPRTSDVDVKVIGPHSGAARPIGIVPAGVWQASRPLGAYCLVSCTVAPGFEFSDFRLIADIPEHEPALRPYTSLF